MEAQVAQDRPHSGPRLPPLAGFYALYFATVGITVPFLPAYLRSLGLSGPEIGALLALSPLMSLLTPPLFGHLADRTGRPDRVLTAIAVGAGLGFFPLYFATDFRSAALAMAAHAFFAASVTPLVDSLALQRVAARGGSFARIRLFGSVGFVLSSTAFGLSVSVIDQRTVLVALVLMFTYGLFSLSLRTPGAPMEAQSPWAGLALLRHRDLRVLLTSTCLHWIACAPYHGTFSIHVTALGLPPSVVGLSAGLGVVAEVVVMYFYPSFASRVAPRHLLFAAFAVSVARWVGMALTSSPGVIVALSCLHGFTFAAFYVGAVGFVARRVPAELRASGQALFVAMTFGVGGLVGYLGAGTGYDLLGGHQLFAVAAALEAVAALWVLRAKTPTHPSPTLGRE